MAVVLLTTLAWIYSLAAVFHAILAPILLKLIASQQVLRLIFLTYIFQVVLFPALIYVWYTNESEGLEPKRRKSVAPLRNGTDADEATALLSDAHSSSRESTLRNRRNSGGRSENASPPSETSAGTDMIGLKHFLLKRKLRTALMVLAIVTNTVLFGLCLDFTFSDYLFQKNYDLVVSRVGGIGPDFAKIFVRSPAEHQIQLEYQRVEGDAGWQSCESSVAVSPSSDYTASVKCTGLSPETQYRYRWRSVATGRSILPESDERDMGFKTAPPDRAPAKFSFAYTSCVKPGFPYGTKGLRGFHEIGRQDLSFVLFLGDLIYADAPYLYGTDVDTYRWHYRYLYSKPDFRKTFRRLPFMTIYDDHEVLNNWEWDSQQPYPAAFQAFNEYAGLSNPHEDANVSAIFEYEFGDTAFFVMDTRGYRNREEETMLGEKQKTRLKDWLLAVNSTHTVKFLVSSVPFTQNWQWEHTDTWAGFLKERQEILDFISRNRIQNVLAISGDRHEVAITRLPGNVIEFSTSPLQAFYSPIDTYIETGQDEKIFSWRPGNIKWAMFTIDTTRSTPTATYALFVNDYQDTPVYEKTFPLSRS
ncbi:hypothetical protein SpCBS45565_g00409 [Spizellomyces sp. 'palustris']|nr:hypothetical protein SpCBS45565_g00409 [Spizellomyces sp. 'palustris']